MAAVPYDEALATLQSMFGGLDRDVVVDVLESHGCQMEPTVDALLILTQAQSASPRKEQPRRAPDMVRRSFSSTEASQGPHSSQTGSSRGFGSNSGPSGAPRDEYQDALGEETRLTRKPAANSRNPETLHQQADHRGLHLATKGCKFPTLLGLCCVTQFPCLNVVSGSMKEKLATAPQRTVSAGSAAMRKLTEVLADWGLTSRRSSSEYSLAHENDYAGSAADDSQPPASTSYAGTLVDKVQSATAEAIGGVSSSFQRRSSAKHRQRAGHEGESLLQESSDFEDGALLSREETRKEERRSLTSTREQDEEDDEEYGKKEH